MCAGCLNPISPWMKLLRCHFATKGFTKNETQFKPCAVLYHVDCIRVGEPFRTRLPERQGLTYPAIDGFPIFICEACSVRGVLMRGLRSTKLDQIQEEHVFVSRDGRQLNSKLTEQLFCTHGYQK